MDAQAGLASLRNLSPQAELMTEGGQTVVFLPSVQFEAKGSAVTRNLLLWPGPRDGYLTRLFLSEQAASTATRAWTAYSLCGGTWWAVSWQGVPADLPWIEILAGHLGAFK
jgi:hypothetical protein